MDIYIFLVLAMLVGYIIGSIPFALVIGKGIYKTDVRKYGSGNLGSTNVARTLGPIPGLVVLILDLLKGGLTSFIMYKIAYNSLLGSGNLVYIDQASYAPTVYFVCGLFVCLGHSHPLFSNFKGGKCVACMFGILLFFNWKLSLIGGVFFFGTIFIIRIVSLGSILASISIMVSLAIPWARDSFLFDIENRLTGFIYSVLLIAICVLVLYRHISNIQNIVNKKEKKFSFGHKEKEKIKED